jgi:REP element-mobilizing transposase RayT
MVNRVLAKHAHKTHVKVLGTGNAGNHLHLRLQFSSRAQYCHFIRAVTGEIALQIKKISNLNIPSTRTTAPSLKKQKSFWDQRPFSSIVSTLKYAARLADYIRINELEGEGYPRAFARLFIETWRDNTPVVLRI